MAGFFNGIVNGISGLPWLGLYYSLRAIFIVLDVLIVAGFIYVFKKAWEYRPDLIGSFGPQAGETAGEKPRLNAEHYRKHWEEIMAHAEDTPPQSLTLAVIAADNLVDDALKEMGFEGEHMADRLQQLRKEALPSLDDLWRAHRIRNDLVHTVGFTLTPNETREVLSVYERSLRDIGALE